MFPIAGGPANLDRVAVIHASGHDTAVKSLDPFGIGKRDLQTFRDVRSDVIATQPHAIAIDHMPLDIDGNTRGPAAQIDAGRSKFLLILDQCGQSRNIGR